MRMLGPEGESAGAQPPDVIAHLQRAEGLHFELSLKA
jgi:hypothetical protein